MSLLFLLLEPVVFFAAIALLRLVMRLDGGSDRWWSLPLFMTIFFTVWMVGVSACIGILILAVAGVS